MLEVRQKSPFLWAVAIPPIYPSSQAFRAPWPPGEPPGWAPFLNDIQLETPTN